MSFEAAARILTRHHMQSRPSAQPGCIDALAEFTDRSGRVSAEWEAVPLNAQAILDWLGY